MMSWFGSSRPHQKQPTLNDRAIERLLDSPLARQAAEDEERERLDRRRQLCAEVEDLRRPDLRLEELRAKEEDATLKQFRRDAIARADAALLHTEGGGFRDSREDVVGRRHQVALASNTTSVRRVVAALRDAIAEVERLQLTVTPDAEIEARIATWRRELNVPPEEAEPIPGQPRPWRDNTRAGTRFPEIEVPMNPAGPILTPHEQRQAAWRAEEGKR